MGGVAPGKVILLGEHFVVHGAPAIALPLAGATVRVEIERAPGPWRVPAAGRDHVVRMLERLGEDPARLAVTVASGLPIGEGLGSSAALAVALVRALGVSDDREVRRRAHDLERLAHGDPSGIDDAVATYGQPVWYVRGTVPEPIDMAGGAPPPLWVATTGVRAATREAVARVAAWRQRHPERFARLLERATGLVHAGRDALAVRDDRALGHAMDDNHGLLATVGVTTAALDQLVGAARRAGALGAKLTGAGCGGAMVALASQGADLEPALRAAGAVEVLRP